jgi:hypothetical protein
LIAPYILAPFALFPFHPSISLRADLLLISGELTGNPENRLEYFGELIAHVVGNASRRKFFRWQTGDLRPPACWRHRIGFKQR